MTDPITLTLRDLIALGIFLFAMIGTLAKLWWSLYRIRHNDLDDLEKTVDDLKHTFDKRISLLARDFDDFKERYYLERERDAENRGKIHACLKNVQADVAELQKKLNKTPS